VLVIDDSDLSLELAATALEGADFDIRTLNTVANFDATVGDWRPDVILTDVKMPGISGVELCRFLKSRYETAHVPVVLFSAAPSAELAIMARECDADGYLSKVHGFDKLGEEISRLIDTVLF
jgi:DNA-binding response OmpR family regulator